MEGSASRQIDAIVKKSGDWRSDMLARLRIVIKTPIAPWSRK
jgi:hypothetical protein